MKRFNLFQAVFDRFYLDGHSDAIEKHEFQCSPKGKRVWLSFFVQTIMRRFWQGHVVPKWIEFIQIRSTWSNEDQLHSRYVLSSNQNFKCIYLCSFFCLFKLFLTFSDVFFERTSDKKRRDGFRGLINRKCSSFRAKQTQKKIKHRQCTVQLTIADTNRKLNNDY